MTGYSGYHTPAGMGARSIRSNSSRAPSVAGGYPTFSTTGSVMSYSESDAGSSIRAPPSVTSWKSRTTRENKPGLGVPSRHIERVEEHEDWPAQDQGHENRTYTLSGNGQSGVGQYTLPALNTSQSGGYGGFLVLDEMMDDQRSFLTAMSSNSRKDRAALSAVRGGTGGGGSSRHERPSMGTKGDSETESVGPIIKDFDALDVIDDHAP